MNSPANATNGLSQKVVFLRNVKSRLKTQTVKEAKPREKPYKMFDGGSLYLFIVPNGTKSWRYKYRISKKEKLITLGLFPLVSLQDARQKLERERRLISQGLDPMAERRISKISRDRELGNDFKTTAIEWWKRWSSEKNEKFAVQELERLKNYTFPIIGSHPIADITAPMIIGIVKTVAKTGKIELAHRLLSKISMILRDAIAHGELKNNVAADIKPSEVLPKRKVENHARVDLKELPTLMNLISTYNGTLTRYALQFLAATFVRTSELIGAEWKEIDFDSKTWTIPLERMKRRRRHIVPLSDQAVEILRELFQLTGSGTYVFPGGHSRNQHMSNNTILKALERLGYKGQMTGHGFRGIASTYLHECGRFEHMHIDIQLAHQEQNTVSAAYNHATYLPQRRVLMQAWSDYLFNQNKRL